MLGCTADIAEVLQVRRAEDSGLLEYYVHYPERMANDPFSLAYSV